MLEEGLQEHDHITLNTTIYCVTKQQIDNGKFIYEPTTIVLYKLLCKPWKQHSADSKLKIIDYCLETPINSKITYRLLINLLGAPGKKSREATLNISETAYHLDPPPHPPSEFPLTFTRRLC